MSLEGGLYDVHVHLFPPRVNAAIWRWFDRHAWPVLHRMEADQVVEHLVAAGVERMVGLAYSHVPGMARSLNDFMHAVARRHAPHVIPFGTVLPGEEGWAEEVDRAFGPLGMAGLKIHCHVQNLTPDDERMLPLFEAVARHDKVLLIHCGREPNLHGYQAEPKDLCSVERFYQGMRRTPDAKVIVPHLGADETDAYLDLLAQFPNLYLDTAMALGSPQNTHPHLAGFRPDFARLARASERILFGTDFPNLPYPWATELQILRTTLPTEAFAQVVEHNARRLFA